MKEKQIKMEEQFPEECKAVVLGDEGCVHKALHERWSILLKRAVEQGKEVRFITPMIPDKYCSSMYDYIKEMCSLTTLKVTFNDYGFLFMCKPLIQEKKIIPVIGRVLTRSMLDCAWHEKLLEGEEEEQAQILRKHSLLHSNKLDLLQEIGVQEVELNIESYESVKELQKQGIHCICYGNNSMISMGRICYAARWHHMNVPECVNSKICFERLHFELEEMWGNEKLMYEKPTPTMKGYLDNSYIEGNTVYKALKQGLEDRRLDVFDGIIF